LRDSDVGFWLKGARTGVVVQIAGRSEAATFVTANVVDGTDAFLGPVVKWLPDPIGEQAQRRAAATANAAEIHIMPTRVSMSIVFTPASSRNQRPCADWPRLVETILEAAVVEAPPHDAIMTRTRLRWRRPQVAGRSRCFTS